MKWEIQYASSAARAIRRLDPQIRRRVRAAMETLQENPERGKPLRFSLEGLRSWRTGDYRIVYRVVHQRLEVFVITVGHRRDVYSRLRQKLDP